MDRILTGGALFLSVAGAAFGGTYTFTKAVDTSGALGNLYTPAVNNSGAVAFAANNDSNVRSVYRYDGSLSLLKSPGGSYTSFSTYVDMNNNGDVVYMAGGNTASAIFANNSSTPLQSGGSSRFGNLTNIAINDAGQYAFVDFDSATEGIHRGSLAGGTPTYIRSSIGGLLFGDTRVSITPAGKVGYNFYANPLITVNISDGTTNTVIADNGGPLSIMQDPIVSDNGHTLIRCDYDAGGGTGLFLKSGATLYELANSTGPLSMVRNACMNNAGQYAFLASRDDGSQAIYVGSGTNYELLISTGTMLDGNVLTGLALSSQGISENGKIGFVTYSSTSNAIYVAAVPEPGVAGVLAMTVISALGLRQRR